MNIIVLDAKKLTSKGEAHEYLRRMFSFPDWYGKNLDALYDCLGDLPNGTVVMVYGADGLTDYAGRVLGVIEEAAGSGALRLIKK